MTSPYFLSMGRWPPGPHTAGAMCVRHPYLSLPVGCMPASRHRALRPQQGLNAQSWQTSKLIRDCWKLL